jgi:hypothetical protein
MAYLINRVDTLLHSRRNELLLAFNLKEQFNFLKQALAILQIF